MPPVLDTKSRILDVAEELFGDQGLDRVSIRDITEMAEVNLAAVNYHFGSKEELIQAVFERRLNPLNEARLAALDKVELAARGQPPELEEVLGAFIYPAVDCCVGSSKGGGGAFAKLLGRCLAETRPEVEAFLWKFFAPLAARFEAAFLRALPELTPEEVFWRMKFTFGALHHWLLTRNKFVPPCAEKTGVEEQTRKLIAFTAAGFRAH
jgi:AcrR family transcriptional regulator